MGVYIPDYVDAGLEMHTNMYHESSLNAKVNINSNQIKLSIPAPKSNTQLFSVRLVAPISYDINLFPKCYIYILHEHNITSVMLYSLITS